MRTTATLILLLGLGCATRPPVSLDHYRGVFTTHFDGVPDRSAICAVLTNRGERPVDWVRLRLRAYPQGGETESGRSRRFTSFWVFEGRLRPGETRTVQLVRPPIAEGVELVVRSAGQGNPRVGGRKVAKTRGCSESSLRRRLKVELKGRTAPGISFFPIVRRNSPSAEVVLALEE